MRQDISVIIPVYNVKKYLKDCLESVIHQSCSNIEIICVNDGSTDGSAEILREYQNRDARIQVVTQENRGLSEARNAGIKHANGEYICFLDSDDMLCVGALEKLYEQARWEELEILCYDAECIYESEELHKTQYKDFYYQRKKSYGQAVEGREIFADMVEDNAFCDAAWILFIKREWLLENDIWFWPGLIHEDCLFSFLCFMKAKRVTHTNERYYIYRIRENSIMTSRLGYGSVYGRLVCFHHILQTLYDEKLPGKYQKAVIQFAKWIKGNAKWIGSRLSGEELKKLEELPTLPRFELELMEVKPNPIDKSMYEKGFLCELDEAQTIVLYGAGKRGKKVLQYLRLRGYFNKVRNYVVSERGDNTVQLDGVRIEALDEGWTISKESLILVCIQGAGLFEVGVRLRDLEYRKVILVDENLVSVIYQAIKNEAE